MRASSGTSSNSSVLLNMVSAKPADTSAPPETGTSTTFEDVMQQQEGGTSNTSGSQGKAPSDPTDKASNQQVPTSKAPADKNSPTPPASKPPSPLTPGPVAKASNETAPEAAPPADIAIKGKPTPLPVTSDLSAMIIQATAMASNAGKTLVSTTPPGPVAETPAKPGDDSNPDSKSEKNPFQLIPGGPDLSAMIVQALILASSAQRVSVPSAPTDPAAKTPAGLGNDSGPGTTSAKNPSQLISVVPDLTTLMAQASALATNAQPASASASISTATPAPAAKTTVGLGKELPLLGSTKGAPASPTKEKKSVSASAEGSFLQSDSASSETSSSPLGLLGLSLAHAGNSSSEQQLTSNDASKNLTLNGLFGSASSIAGTANVEKEKAMNATLNFPEIFSGNLTNTVSQQAPADMHIQLSTNNDFEDAMKQVMHVAQLTQTNESRVPMRVAMEIQTPPGAIVNVYVSRQNDQWRAQLSTNDPQALSWVQDKMNTLRQSNDSGVEVRWLPPQMETTSTSSSNDSNLAWDRGGQGQQGYQNQDDRQQSGRQKKAELFAGIGTGQFMNTLTALGRAA